MALLIARRDRPAHWEQLVASVYQPWVLASPYGRMIITADSSHYIQNDEPELVSEAIRRTVFLNAITMLSTILARQGIDAAVQQYREMKQRYQTELLTERTLNSLGYAQLYSSPDRSSVQNISNAESRRQEARVHSHHSAHGLGGNRSPCPEGILWRSRRGCRFVEVLAVSFTRKEFHESTVHRNLDFIAHDRFERLWPRLERDTALLITAWWRWWRAKLVSTQTVAPANTLSISQEYGFHRSD
jgi:hypothetical protein